MLTTSKRTIPSIQLPRVGYSNNVTRRRSNIDRHARTMASDISLSIILVEVFGGSYEKLIVFIHTYAVRYSLPSECLRVLNGRR